MSQTLAPPPAASTPAGGSSTAEGQRPLQQRQPRRPQDFGLDTARLRRWRQIAFALLAVPLLLLALLAAKFISMPITQAWHGSAYDAGRYEEATGRLGPVEFANWFEPYLPHLTKGTDLLQLGRDAEAETELAEALRIWEASSDLNQPQHAMCKIRNNLAIAIERQAAGIADPQQKADRLFEAEEIIAPCASGGGGGDGEGGGQGQDGTGNEDGQSTRENGERIREARRKADEQAGNDPDARSADPGDQGEQGEDPGNGTAPQDPGDPVREDPEGTEPPEEAPTQGSSEDQQREEELEQRNEEANQGDGEEPSDGSTADPEQPW